MLHQHVAQSQLTQILSGSKRKSPEKNGKDEKNESPAKRLKSLEEVLGDDITVDAELSDEQMQRLIDSHNAQVDMMRCATTGKMMVRPVRLETGEIREGVSDFKNSISHTIDNLLQIHGHASSGKSQLVRPTDFKLPSKIKIWNLRAAIGKHCEKLGVSGIKAFETKIALTFKQPLAIEWQQDITNSDAILTIYTIFKAADLLEEFKTLCKPPKVYAPHSASGYSGGLFSSPSSSSSHAAMPATPYFNPYSFQG